MRRAVGLFALQMAFNVTWTPAFFGLESPLAGLVVIGCLLVLVVATIAAFARVDRRAAALLVPYLVWVGFATWLNGAIWSENG